MLLAPVLALAPTPEIDRAPEILADRRSIRIIVVVAMPLHLQTACHSQSTQTKSLLPSKPAPNSVKCRPSAPDSRRGRGTAPQCQSYPNDRQLKTGHPDRSLPTPFLRVHFL
jgi:hypothetical protein